jgi:nitronate monooxygenase
MQTRLTDLFGIELPIVQAPMAGCNDAQLAIEVCEAGGLGSLPCALLDPAGVRQQLGMIRAQTERPFNVNFFCHAEPTVDPVRRRHWRESLSKYYVELDVDIQHESPAAGRTAFDEVMCEVIEEFRPPVVSFHFGLPSAALVDRVRAAGAMIMSSATSVAEARWLVDRGCDVVIAQGVEAGGHRGMFLTSDVATQMGTIALVPQIVDAVPVPVIAAGGIADARGVAAALLLGAEGVQLGTAYLRCPEATTSPLHRAALERSAETTLTNVFTGRPARAAITRVVRDLGPMSSVVPEFPLAVSEILPLRIKAESIGSDEFTPVWSGQSGALATARPARALTRELVEETRQLLATAVARDADRA